MNRWYQPWVNDGKPWKMATPIAEVVSKLKAARPAAAKAGIFGSIGDYAHLTATNPQDHTPYSRTGWPKAHPYPYLTATDIMHRPDLGVDCNQIFPHWLAAAKAGKLPWLKYLIWQRKRYDVRNNWAPVSASGHDDHMHASSRTDHIGTSIGSWHPLPGEDDDTMFCLYGDKGPKVKALQLQLLQLDPGCLPRFGADGGYGEETRVALSRLVTGGEAKEYGPDGWALMQQLVAAKFGKGEKGDPGEAGKTPTRVTVIVPGAELTGDVIAYSEA